MLFAILFLIVPQNEVKAVGYGLIGQVGKKVSNSDLQKMSINFKNVKVSTNLSGAYTTNSSGYAIGNGVETYMPIGTYTFRANSAFTFKGSTFDLLMTVRVNDVSTTATGRRGVTAILRNGVSSNLDVQIYNYNASVIVTYDIFYTGTSNHADYNFAYGFGDPDGGDYLYSGVLNSDVYYISATKEGGNYTFENAFRISSEGIRVVAADCAFDDGLIVIANNNPSSGFSINWSTMPDSSRPYMSDYMFIPNIYYKPTTLNIRMNMNGGYLDSAHGSNIGTSGDLVTLYQSTTIHQLLFGQSLGSDGLANYNNSSYINIKRKGHNVPAGQEYYTLDGNNNKTYFNQTTAYAATDFASNDGQSHTVTLYVNWQPKTFKVTYNGNGGTWNNQSSWHNNVVYGNTYTVESNFYTRKGYEFAGWKDPTGVTWDENWSGTWNYDNGQYGITNEELVLTAQWTPKTYTVRYEGNGGTWNGETSWSNTVLYGGTYTVQSNFYSKEGYTFASWKDPTGVTWDEGWSGTWNYDNGQYGITNNELVLTAQWNPINYTIDYTLNGGNSGTYAPTSGTFDNVVRISNPTKTGYTFKGWTMTNGNTSTALHGTSTSNANTPWNPATTLVKSQYFKNLRSASGVVTLTANWEISMSNFRIDTNGGSTTVGDINMGTISGTQTITSIATFIKEYGKIMFVANPTKDSITNRVSISVSYNGAGGVVSETQENTVSFRDDTINYNFSGWTFYITNGTWGKTALYNGAQVDSYTFGPNAGETDDIVANYTSSTTYGTPSVVVLPNATKPGYTLKGWYTAESGGTKIGDPGGTYRPNANVTLHAQWTAIPVTITIRKDNANWDTNNGVKIELRQSGITKYSATASSSSVSISPVVEGTYDVYASKNANSTTNLNTLVDTGVNVTVTSTGIAIVDYYSLGLQRGVGISAVSGGGTYLKNQVANIDATVSAGYTWQGWSVVSGNSPN